MDLYEFMQDPAVSAKEKQAILQQLQERAQPEGHVLPTLAALVGDAALGYAATKGLQRWGGEGLKKIAGKGKEWTKDTRLEKYAPDEHDLAIMGGALGGGVSALAGSYAYDKWLQSRYKDPLEQFSTN